MSPPTDLELMMFHDGELDEARHREIQAFLVGEGSPAKAGAAKLADLGLVSALLQETQAIVAHAQAKQADSIAAAVLGRLDETSAFEGDKPATGATRASKLEGGAQPANDNGRFIMVLTGLAAAAAAALFVWGRSAPPETPSAAVDIVEVPTAEAVETVAVTPPIASTPASASVASVAEESQPSVEVASVDFSAASGAVYYVPSESAGQTTAVVWLKDE